MEEALIYQRIKLLCVENGTTMTTLLKEITGGGGNMPTWKKGHIRSDYLIAICLKFNVSADNILGIQRSHLTLFENERTEQDMKKEVNQEVVERAIEIMREKILDGSGRIKEEYYTKIGLDIADLIRIINRETLPTWEQARMLRDGIFPNIHIASNPLTALVNELYDCNVFDSVIAQNSETVTRDSLEKWLTANK